MELIILKPIERTYKNNGQHAEQILRFTLTGEIVKADHNPAEMGGDCLDIQIKSQKATVCKGSNLEAYLDMDGASRWAYVNKDFTKAYIMNRSEWIEFVGLFGYVSTESVKNGGATKIRLREETARMAEWLTSHTA